MVRFNMCPFGCSTAVGKRSLATLRWLTLSWPDGSVHFRCLERAERTLCCFNALTLAGTTPPSLAM